jgi:hypothetical protein
MSDFQSPYQQFLEQAESEAAMTQQERDKITEFVASMGFEHTDDLMVLTESIENRMEDRRRFAARRDAKEKAHASV